MLSPCPHPGGRLVVSRASRCVHLLLFLVVEHMCQVPVGGKKEGEIYASPQLWQGQLLKERKSKLSASVSSSILVHLLKPQLILKLALALSPPPFSNTSSRWRSPNISLGICCTLGLYDPIFCNWNLPVLNLTTFSLPLLPDSQGNA